MTSTFSIKSVTSDTEFVLLDVEGDYFHAEIRGSEIAARHRIWGYTDCDMLVDDLNFIASQKGDEGFPAEWSSIESDLTLQFRCDALGHVFVNVAIQRYSVWKVEVEIETELGQMPTLAKEAARFFKSAL